MTHLLRLNKCCAVLYFHSYIQLYPVILHECIVTLSIQDCSFGAELLSARYKVCLLPSSTVCETASV